MFKIKKVERARVFPIEFEFEGESFEIKFTMERPKPNEFYELMTGSTVALAIAKGKGEEVTGEQAINAMGGATKFTASKIKRIEGIEIEDGSELKPQDYEYSIPFFVIQKLTDEYIPWAVACLTGSSPEEKKKEPDSKVSNA